MIGVLLCWKTHLTKQTTVAKWMNTNNEYVDEHIIIPILIYVVDTISLKTWRTTKFFHTGVTLL